MTLFTYPLEQWGGKDRLCLAVRSPFALCLVSPHGARVQAQAVEGRTVRRLVHPSGVDLRLLCPFEVVESVEPWRDAALVHPLNLLPVPRHLLASGQELRGYHNGLGAEYALMRATVRDAVQRWATAPGLREAALRLSGATLRGLPIESTGPDIQGPWRGLKRLELALWLSVKDVGLATLLMLGPACYCHAVPDTVLPQIVQEGYARLWRLLKRELRGKAKGREGMTSTALRMADLEAVRV